MGKEHLYIVGNGFDLYHGAKSSYWHFRGYLLQREEMAAKAFEEFFGPRATVNNFDTYRDWELTQTFGDNVPFPRNTWAMKTLWRDFERYLSEFDREKIFDMVEDSIPRYDEHDWRFKASHYFAPIDRIHDVIILCTFEMQYHFHRWVNTLQYRKGHKRDMIDLNPDAAFLNFNYTLFLEDHYKINSDNICYIHGNRRMPFGSLVLGHSKTNPDALFDEWFHKHKNRKRYRPNLKDCKGRYFANDKLVYLAYFHDDDREGIGNYRLQTRYDAIQRAQEYVEDYFDYNMKDCDQIIDNHQDFFCSLDDIRRITVLGHSLSDVDMPYFREIMRHIKRPDKVVWEISCHNEKDVVYRDRFCKAMNIQSENIARPFDISDLRLDRAGAYSHPNEGETNKPNGSIA